MSRSPCWTSIPIHAAPQPPRQLEAERAQERQPQAPPAGPVARAHLFREAGHAAPEKPSGSRTVSAGAQIIGAIVSRVSGPPRLPSGSERPSRGDVDADLAYCQRVQQPDPARPYRTRASAATGVRRADPRGRRVRAGSPATDPDLIVAPMLTRAFPRTSGRAWPSSSCTPGPMGDRGPSSLDWAITGGAEQLGRHRPAGRRGDGRRRHLGQRRLRVARCGRRAQLYRNEVADAAVDAVLLAVTRSPRGRYRPDPLDYGRPDVRGRPAALPPIRRTRLGRRRLPRRCCRRLRAADSQPGVLDALYRRHRVLPVRRVPRRRLRGRPRDDPGPAGRRDLPGHRGRGGLDPAAAPASGARRPDDLQAARHPRARAATGRRPPGPGAR